MRALTFSEAFREFLGQLLELRSSVYWKWQTHRDGHMVGVPRCVDLSWRTETYRYTDWEFQMFFIGEYMAMDQYLLIPFLGGWTSIYQLFWCSPGVQGFDPSPYTVNASVCFQNLTIHQSPAKLRAAWGKSMAWGLFRFWKMYFRTPKSHRMIIMIDPSLGPWNLPVDAVTPWLRRVSGSWPSGAGWRKACSTRSTRRLSCSVQEGVMPSALSCDC